MSPKEKFWTDDKLTQLRALWEADQLHASEIGRVLGCNKNAVIGKAHKLGLRRKRIGTRIKREVVIQPWAGARYGSAAHALSPWYDDGSGVLTRTLTS